MKKDLLHRQPLIAAANEFSRAAQASRLHSALVRSLLDKYGDGNGRQISGVIRDHFPEKDKDTLKALCRDICRYNEAGHALRPKGVHHRTMDALARAVCRRDGTGFYGYKV